MIGSTPSSSAPVKINSLSCIECIERTKNIIATAVSSAKIDAVRIFGESSMPTAVKPKRLTGRVPNILSIFALTVTRLTRIADTKSSSAERICCQS